MISSSVRNATDAAYPSSDNATTPLKHQISSGGLVGKPLPDTGFHLLSAVSCLSDFLFILCCRSSCLQFLVFINALLQAIGDSRIAYNLMNRKHFLVKNIAIYNLLAYWHLTKKDFTPVMLDSTHNRCTLIRN